jgi:hypothetical protein
MKQTHSKFVIFIAAILTASMLLAAGTPIAQANATRDISPSQTFFSSRATKKHTQKIDPLIFQQAVRKLWEDHITWTRDYIISALAGLPEADAAAQRLLQNQVDIGNAIKPFYGETAGNQLTSLLRDHILIAVDLLAAARSGDNAGFQDALNRWYANADQIASFLNSANPKSWPLNEMKSMMNSHLDLTLAEATARLNGDWSGDVAAYENVHSEILQMADMLASGIVHQFPKMFTKRHVSDEKASLTLAMNKLWEDHVTWTRMYIISFTTALPDAEAAAGRLLQNQVDIGNAIKPFYGEQAGDQLTSLLRDHILIAVDILVDAKSGNATKFEIDKTRWYANADQIAAFLNSANPENWSLSDMRTMMKTHLDLTLNEATARLNGDWVSDVAAYDKIHNEILDMAGMLTAGIIAQFPGQFK